MSDVYAGDPYSRDVPAVRNALTAGLNALRWTVDVTIVHTIRGDGPKRTRNRRACFGRM